MKTNLQSVVKQTSDTLRSAPVPGRSNVNNPVALEKFERLDFATLLRPGTGALRPMALLLTLAFAFATTASAQTNTAKEVTPLAPGDYSNWIELGGGGYFSSGDKAQFQRRSMFQDGAFGGIESLHLEDRVGERGTITLDGRSIFDNHDYLMKLRVSEPDKGYFEFGFSGFRTWYDGSGGYFPGGTNHSFSLYNEELFVDRDNFWFETGLRLPNVPEITFRFSQETRDGKKDSTIWGDTIRLGIAGANNARGIVPSFLKLDEVRTTLALDLKHRLSKTDFGAGLRYEDMSLDNTRNIHRRPGELTGSVTVAADRFVTQRETVHSDMFNAHGFTTTRFNDKSMLSFGGSYTRLETDIGGSRIYGSDYDAVYDPLFARRQQRDVGFFNLHGGTVLDQYVGNMSYRYAPMPAFVIVPSLRVEHMDQHGIAEMTETDFGAAPARAVLTENLINTHERGFTDLSGALELRYTGFTNWVLYTRGEWLVGEGNSRERQADADPDVAPALIERDTDSTRFTQKYVAGVNWYPLRRLNMSAQYYHKARANSYDHRLDLTPNAPPSGNRYPAYLTDQDFTTDDMNFRVTVRPLNNLTLVSRYDFQLSTVDTRADALAEMQSAEVTSHIFSQSVSWSPFARLYLQGNVSYALDQTETPFNDFIGSATNNIVPKSENNYWNAGATAGFALDDRTDLNVQYNYYRADNFTDNSAFSMPYGSDTEEHMITATLSRQITSRLRWSLKYAYLTYQDNASGGNNDFDAHLVYTSIQYRF